MRSKKKKKPLKLFTKQKLHSKNLGKSTYFYKQRWFLHSIPLASTLALLLVMGLCINPVGGLSGVNGSDSKKVYAADNIPGEPGYDDIVPENGVALRIDTTLNDKDTIEEQVSGSGTQYIKVDFTVGANNIQNYNVYVQADSTALTGQAHGDKLQSITSNTTGTVGTRQWGYGVSRGSVDPSTMTYKPIQTSVSTSADSQDAGEGKTLTGISQPYTLAFAANLEGAASDHYKSNITLSVAAGATETTNLGIGFAGKTYMQDVTKSFCDNSSIAIGTEGRLIDNRDGKIYWVAKQKDGLCWMTQNLAYDGGGAKVDTPEIPESTAAQYYNPGAYVYTDPTKRNSCADTKVGLSDCIGKGWKKIEEQALTIVSDNTWTATDLPSFYGATSYIATDGTTICNKETNSYFGDMASDYIPCRIYSKYYLMDEELHYSAGNYYNFSAATNNTGNSAITDGALASGSVCPTGWSLPLSGSVNNAADGSFYNLLSRYNVQNSLTSDNYDIRLAPLYFVYGGRIISNAMNGAGADGFYWSSVGFNDISAYSLYLVLTVNPSNISRYYGFPVRCVAR